MSPRFRAVGLMLTVPLPEPAFTVMGMPATASSMFTTSVPLPGSTVTERRRPRGKRLTSGPYAAAADQEIACGRVEHGVERAERVRPLDGVAISIPEDPCHGDGHQTSLAERITGVHQVVGSGILLVLEGERVGRVTRGGGVNDPA